MALGCTRIMRLNWGLLGRVNNMFYLTPAGSSFILLLQLHKSVNFVDAMRAYK